jgi:hypothetical protein
VSYRLHPAAAEEHLEHISFYEAQRSGLGARYDKAFEITMRLVCEFPTRFKLVAAGAPIALQNSSASRPTRGGLPEWTN